jgi:adenylate kinase
MEAVIFVGIPGSGKTTFFRRARAPAHQETDTSAPAGSAISSTVRKKFEF